MQFKGRGLTDLDEKEFLIELASNFRQRIESYCKNMPGNLPHGITLMSDFPKGCCHDASLLLARYFREHGIQSCVVLNDHHAWLQVHNYYIDITADQFGEGFFSVEVVDVGDRRFRIITSKFAKHYEDSDYHSFDAEIHESFDMVYAEIMTDPQTVIT
jgi:hypothetical protein